MLQSRKTANEPLFRVESNANTEEETLRRTATFFTPNDIHENILRFSFQKSTSDESDVCFLNKIENENKLRGRSSNSTNIQRKSLLKKPLKELTLDNQSMEGEFWRRIGAITTKTSCGHREIECNSLQDLLGPKANGSNNRAIHTADICLQEGPVLQNSIISRKKDPPYCLDDKSYRKTSIRKENIDPNLLNQQSAVTSGKNAIKSKILDLQRNSLVIPNLKKALGKNDSDVISRAIPVKDEKSTNEKHNNLLNNSSFFKKKRGEIENFNQLGKSFKADRESNSLVHTKAQYNTNDGKGIFSGDMTMSDLPIYQIRESKAEKETLDSENLKKKIFRQPSLDNLNTRNNKFSLKADRETQDSSVSIQNRSNISSGRILTPKEECKQVLKKSFSLGRFLSPRASIMSPSTNNFGDNAKNSLDKNSIESRILTEPIMSPMAHIGTPYLRKSNSNGILVSTSLKLGNDELRFDFPPILRRETSFASKNTNVESLKDQADLKFLPLREEKSIRCASRESSRGRRNPLSSKSQYISLPHKREGMMTFIPKLCFICLLNSLMSQIVILGLNTKAIYTGIPEIVWLDKDYFSSK